MIEAANFGALPPEYSRAETAEIVIVPVPYDGTSTYVKGADKGPEAIIRASGNMELYDIETDSQVYLHGIFTDEPVRDGPEPEKMVRAVERRVGRHLADDKFVIVLNHIFSEKHGFFGRVIHHTGAVSFDSGRINTCGISSHIF